MNPADLTLNTSPTLPSSLVNKNGSLIAPTKAQVPRVDIEPIYTQLKGALGDSWNDYKTSLSAFVLGMFFIIIKTGDVQNVDMGANG